MERASPTEKTAPHNSRKLTNVLLHPATINLATSNECSKSGKSKAYIYNLNRRHHQRLPSFDSNDTAPSHRIYENAAATADGNIYERDALGKYQWIRHTGGCGCAPPLNTRSLTPAQADLNQAHAQVITLACRWGDQTWHFPMEAMVGLYSIPTALLHDQRVLIHLTQITEYTKAWLTLLNIPPDRLIGGTVYAQKLIVPYLGGCGTPHLFQIKALKSTIHNQLKLQSPAQPLSKNGKQKLLVLIERTRSRPLHNAVQLRQAVSAYAARHNFALHLHTDTNLPPLAVQLHLFAQADLVVGPHGGTSVLAPAMQEDKGWVEIMEVGTESENLCGARVSYLCGLRHCIVPSQKLVVNPAHVLQALDRI